MWVSSECWVLSNGKISRLFSRGHTPTNADEDLFTAETQRAQSLAFCLSGDDDKQKHVSIGDNNRSKILKIILNRRLTQTREQLRYLTAEFR